MGSRKTKVPAIPTPRDDNLLEVVNAMKETMEVAEMRRGDKLDAKVTYRDLIDGGLADAAGALGQPAGGSGGSGDPDRVTPGPGSPFLKPPSYEGLVLPGRPANVHTMAAWDAIQVIWDWPEEENSNIYWKRAVVWASATSNFEDATIVGYTTTNMFQHDGIGLSTGTGTGQGPGIRYYWVAWEGLYDEVKGEPARSETNPYPWDAGVYGKTAVSPEYVLNLMEGSINEVHFETPLNSRINLIDYNPDDPSNPFSGEGASVQERILSASVSEDGIYAAIAEVARTSINTDESPKRAAGEWSLRIDANGHVAGFGLSAFSTIDGDGQREESSAFIVSADYFAITARVPYDPNNPWTTGFETEARYPFMVDAVNGIVGIDGELVVDGTITANAIQAGSIGVGQLNAQEIYTDFLTANNIITGTFSTSQEPNMRLEINGEGTSKELFPLWFGRYETGSSDGSVFYADKNGTMKLAGELYVTGAGQFFGGNLASGEHRIEIGGPADDFVLWAGTGAKNKNPNNYVFYIDNEGEAKFRGTLEAEFVSGEVSRTAIISSSIKVVAKSNNKQDVKDLVSSDYTTVDEWTLPYPPFASGHVPYCQVAFNLYGLNQHAGAARIQWKANPTGGWRTLTQSAYDIYNYGETKILIGVAPRRFTEMYFRLQIAGFDGSGPTTGSQNGIVMGIR